MAQPDLVSLNIPETDLKEIKRRSPSFDRNSCRI